MIFYFIYLNVKIITLSSSSEALAAQSTKKTSPSSEVPVKVPVF